MTEKSCNFHTVRYSVLSSKITVLFLLKEYMVHGLGESSEGFLCRLFMANVVEKCKRMAFTADTTQCGNYGNSLSHIFDKNFVKARVLLKKSLHS